MAMTAAERQRRYRERNGRNAGKRRINLIVSAAVVARLDELAQYYGVFKQVMLERVIFEYDLLRRSDGLALKQLQAQPVKTAPKRARTKAEQGANTKTSAKKLPVEKQPNRQMKRRTDAADSDDAASSKASTSVQLLLEF